MSAVRTLVAALLWVLAIVFAVPAFAEIYPVAAESAVLLVDAPLDAARNSTAGLFAAIPWLTLSALLAVNGTLLGIWSSLASAAEPGEKKRGGF